jgi:hypothetical protein
MQELGGPFFFKLENQVDIGPLRVKKIMFKGADCIHLAQDWVQWWATVNRTMNLQVP